MTAPAVGASAPPVSVAQEALWYASLLAPNRLSYNETVSIRKDGAFDAGAFRRAFDEIVRRHEAWRTTLDTIGGAPAQVVRPAPSFDLPLVDLSRLDPEPAERQAARLVAEMSRVPYDVRRGPLVRPRLLRLPAEQHRLYLGLHHLVFDGVSLYRVVVPELIALYDAFSAGRPSPLPEPPSRYADYASWEQEWIAGPRAARRLAYWSEQLAELPVLAVPLDQPRPPAPANRGGVVALSVPTEAVDRLRELGRDAGATLFQVLATTWAVLLSRYSGQDDVVFATPADLRQRPDFQSVVGYCLTPVPLRVDLRGDPSFAELVVRVRNAVLDGLDHLVPFERLVRELHPDGAANANPIYQTMLVMEPARAAPDPAWALHLMETAIGDAVGNAKVDLELQLDERPDGHLAGRLIYDRDLFETATVARMAEHWSRLVGALAAEPTARVSSVPFLSPAEAQRQLVEWNATATEGPRGAVHELVRVWSARQPDAPAVAAGEAALSYAELEARAGAIARRLLAAGVEEGDVVAVASEPSVDLVAGVLGVLQAGAAYLLLDPGLAAERVDSRMTDAGAAAVLASSELAGRLGASGARVLSLDDDDEADAPALGREVAPDAVGCVQYAPVAAGHASAVALRHAAVADRAVALATELGLGPADAVLVLPSTLLHVSALELWLPLVSGARIVMASAELAGDGARLSRLIAREKVSVLHARPSTWQTLIDTGLRPARSLRALSGGEPLSRALADELLDRCRVLWNAYGTVETTGYATLARVERSVPVSVGRPLANARAYVLDEHRRPVPVGVTGELLIAGDGVAAGYRHRSDLTAAAFVADPYGPGRAFRTGDLARWRAGGQLEVAVAERRSARRAPSRAEGGRWTAARGAGGA